MREKIISFIDGIFNPIFSFFDLATEQLNNVATITAQGLNIGQYLSVFGDMPTIWQTVISSILGATVLLGTLLLFRSIFRMYLTTKEGVKWW